MSITLAFDVYGTLIDTAGVTAALRAHVGDQAPAFARLWREKQLEYSFRRGLMENYQDFSICTRNALDYACIAFGKEITTQEKMTLMEFYKALPAFPEVPEALSRLTALSLRRFAFSNGRADDVGGLLERAGIGRYFEDIVSVDEIGTFKPSPAVYAHFLRRSSTTADRAWLISGNPFDVIGAICAGMRAVWVKRSPEMIFDPWGIDPTLTVFSLAELAEVVATPDHPIFR